LKINVYFIFLNIGDLTFGITLVCMDLTLREEYWIKFCTKLIAVISHDVSFIALLVNWYNNRLLPLIW
jgi:hypothetical protein